MRRPCRGREMSLAWMMMMTVMTVALGVATCRVLWLLQHRSLVRRRSRRRSRRLSRRRRSRKALAKSHQEA